MKKIFLVIIVVMLCVVGCGKSTATDASKQKTLDKDVLIKNISGLKFNDSNFKFSKDDNVNNTTALNTYGVELDRMDDYVFYLSSDVVDPSMYMVIKPKDGEKKVVQYQVNEMFNKYYSAYNNYYPKEAKMIKDRLEKEYEGYLVYIISYDNDKVFQEIEESFK